MTLAEHGEALSSSEGDNNGIIFLRNDGNPSESFTEQDGTDTRTASSTVRASTDTPTTNQNNGRGGLLGPVPLTVLVFYSVSGGPFGVEEAVRSAGNLVTLLGFIVMPLVWSLQEALMTAELASTFPEASGGVVWVEQAFDSKLVGWMAGFLSWVGGATDNAIYPALFLEYVVQAFSADDDHDDDDDDVLNPVVRFLLLSGTSILLAYINWLGLDLVSNVSLIICSVAMSPFIILCVVGAFQVDPRQWLKLPELPNATTTTESATEDDVYGLDGGIFSDATFGGVMWRPFLQNLFWQYNSFDSAACFSADVSEPGKTYPIVMKWSVVLVAIGAYSIALQDNTTHAAIDHYEAMLHYNIGLEGGAILYSCL